MFKPASIRRLIGLTILIAFGAILFSDTGAWTDALVKVTTQSGQGSDDSVTWSQLGGDATVLPSATINATSANMLGVTGTLMGVDSVTAVVCPASTCSWSSTGFNSGETLLWTSNDANGGNGPLKLTFANKVSGAGAMIQADGPGKFTAEIQAFNGATSLGAALTETSNANGDALYLGVNDTTGAHITSVTFSITSCTGACTDFAIDTLFINTSGGGGPTPTATPTPAPTLKITAAGLKDGVVNFGKVKVGKKVKKVFILANLNKTHTPITFNAALPTISATSSSGTFEFPTPPVKTTNCPVNMTLLANKKCYVAVYYLPTVVTGTNPADTATLTFSNNASNSPQIIQMEGSGR
jgi:hypothetical protein